MNDFYDLYDFYRQSWSMIAAGNLSTHCTTSNKSMKGGLIGTYGFNIPYIVSKVVLFLAKTCEVTMALANAGEIIAISLDRCLFHMKLRERLAICYARLVQYACSWSTVKKKLERGGT